ncbi:MAG: superoxide dismutase, Ni [Gammaproteobacteria bacterium]|nr:MAG: superoxide dismutase, Ni [Gammaproteobacteria bacterium]
MLFKLFSQLDKQFSFDRVSAHCDVPCGIYDPSTAQIAALTVIRCVDQLSEIDTKASMSLNDHANFGRMVAVKEEHAVKVKEEIRIIWGDFIKQPQLDQYPQLHGLVHDVMLAGSAAKQHVDRDAALKLLDKVNEFAEIFWTIKGVKTYRAICPYAPAVEVVYPDLKND